MTTSLGMARAHISRIRHSRGLDIDGGANMNAEDLHASLEMLSKQLYQKSTRFIMELIQNADDNSYGSNVPELSIILSGRDLRVECNEVGFTDRNVEAISRIDKSTKTADKSVDGYVGEKGIGFKSVFKVADVVWISSGYYSFKFDKRAPLGMVAPIWDAFPYPVRAGHTQFCLRLSDSSDVEGIREELLALQPSLLLFLRRLRKINIEIPGSDCRITLSCSSSIGSVRTLARNSETTDYIVHEHTVDDMPAEERRPRISSSKILLAFPIDKNHEPILTEQEVFTFLPIRSYGFKFLIQADFLLVASREDIDHSASWNRHLLNGIVYAFFIAVTSSCHPHLEYKWPRFLPQGIHPGSFLQPLEDLILSALKNRKVLRSHDGTLELPRCLPYFPPKYRAEDGTPMVPSRRVRSQPLSLLYSDSDIHYLQRLDVHTLQFWEFMERVEDFVRMEHESFRAMPEEWHARLSNILVAKANDRKINKRMTSWEMIPLKTGSWIAPRWHSVFFPKGNTGVMIPEGLDIKTVDDWASENASMRNLFATIGVKECDRDQICRAIVGRHCDLRRGYNHPRLDVKTMVEHVLFLFKSGVTSDLPTGSMEDVRFYDTDASSFCCGSDLYLDDPDIFPLTHYLGRRFHQVKFLHPSYIDAVSGSERANWLNWLRETFDISSIPRLCNSDESVLTPEFQHIIATLSTKEVLGLLKDQWYKYSHHFEGSTVVDTLRSMEVTCKGGFTRPLKCTYLPLGALTEQAPTSAAVAFLDIEDPTDLKWKRLTRFGVGITADLTFYFDCLEGLRRTASAPSQCRQVDDIYKKVDDIYKKIQSLSSGANEELVRQRFRDDALIYLPPKDHSQTGSWVTSNDCVWTAKKYLVHARSLWPLYRNCIRLFKFCLRIRDADSRDVVAELKVIQPGSEDLEQIHLLLKQLNRHVIKDKEVCTLPADLKIFPVRPGRQSSERTWRSATEEWFIADRRNLETSFNGKLALLDLSPDEAERMHPLFETLGMENKMLSVVGKQSLHCKGDVNLDDDYTALLRSKAEYLLRLTPVAYRGRVLQQLSSVEVYAATDVILERFVEISDDSPGNRSAQPKTVHGRPEAGRVVFKPEKSPDGTEVLKIFIAVDDLEPENFPPYQLPAEFSKFCHFDDEKHKDLVTHIFYMNDPARLDEMFDRYDICTGASAEQELDAEDSDADVGNFDHTTTNGPAIRSENNRQDATGGGSSGDGGVFNGMAASLSAALPAPGTSGRRRSRNGVLTSIPGSSAMAAFSETISARNHAQSAEDKRVGIEGERFIYWLLKSLDDSFTPSIWTSKSRNVDFPEQPFTENEGDYADFTVRDTNRKLLSLTPDPWAPPPSEPITYHIEVKSTVYSRNSLFFMSHSQVQKARKYTWPDDGNPQAHLYVIARMYDVDAKPQYHFYPDPWKLYLKGKMELKAPNGYMVSAL